jgi:hypothetical protein
MGQFRVFQFALSTHYSNTATYSHLTTQGVYNIMLSLNFNLGLQSDTTLAWTQTLLKLVLVPVNFFFYGIKGSDICEIK